MSADRFWSPRDRVWRNRHTKTLHFAPESEHGYTCCGICIPAPRSETRHLDVFPPGYRPCGTCYPLGAVLVSTLAAGRHDHAARRKSQRRGRERGCWVYIPAELLPDTLTAPEAPVPWYRVWGGQRGRYIVTLYGES